MNALLALATASVYCLPPWFPSAPLAFYIGRGWLGCLFAFALYGGHRISGLTFSGLVAWESSSSICGAIYVGLAPVAMGSLCDKGTGLPLTLPSLMLTLAACIQHMHRGRRHG